MPSEDARARGTSSDPAAQPRRRRVLLVEDDPDARQLVAHLLRSEGYQVVEASGGVDLLDWILSITWSPRYDFFDVIVSDINMPDISALEVLAALRYATLTTPVLLITAGGDEKTRAEARGLGALAVLEKPLDVAELRAALEAACRRHSLPKRSANTEAVETDGRRRANERADGPGRCRSDG